MIARAVVLLLIFSAMFFIGLWHFTDGDRKLVLKWGIRLAVAVLMAAAVVFSISLLEGLK